MVLNLQRSYKDAWMVEMEGSAFLHAAQSAGTAAVVLRAPMDRCYDRQEIVGEIKDTYQAQAVEAVGSATYRFIEHFVDKRDKRSQVGKRIFDVRTGNFTEAEVQTEVAGILELLTGEKPGQNRTNAGGRCDVRSKGILVEVKRELRSDKTEEEEQLQRYLRAEVDEPDMQRCPTGFLTDGCQWFHYLVKTEAQDLEYESEYILENSKQSSLGLFEWLEKRINPSADVSLHPDRGTIAEYFSGPLFDKNLQALKVLWEEQGAANSDAQLKRMLWRNSLGLALGTHFEDHDTADLFVRHTYLVIVAELIANALFKIPVHEANIERMLNGDLLNSYKLIDLVEDDFFSWVVDVDGTKYVRDLCELVACFSWNEVDHDVLKFLYEEVIPAEVRKALGEYYTPDWLAKLVVDEVVKEPETQTVLDPSCGSGTFLFHAIRHHLNALEKSGIPKNQWAKSATEKIFGFDLHPVAVALARVTYVLALGDEVLDANESELHVPVYLADSMRWEASDPELHDGEDLVIRATGELGHDNRFRLTSPHEDNTLIGGDNLLPKINEEFRFPISLIGQISRFEKVLDYLSRFAQSTELAEDKEISPLLAQELLRFELDAEELKKLVQVGIRLCRLVRESHDGIWHFYLRNLVRPSWLALKGKGVDCLVGNPPWLVYNYMSTKMKSIFKKEAQGRNLWSGGKQASNNDLSALFVVRSAELYGISATDNEAGVQCGFVMPNGILTGGHYSGFRSAEWSNGQHWVLGEPWDCGDETRGDFPTEAAVVFFMSATKAGKMPSNKRIIKSSMKAGVRQRTISKPIERNPMESMKENSVWSNRVFRGATIIPTTLMFIDEVESGVATHRTRVEVVPEVRSRVQEPWLSCDIDRCVVEKTYVFEVLCGEHLLSFRTLPPSKAILPIEEGAVVERPSGSQTAERWKQAEIYWEQHRKDGDARRSLSQRLDYQSDLSKQLDFSGWRVIYNTSGNSVVSALLDPSHHELILNDRFYWVQVPSEDAGSYLVAVLNSQSLSEKIRASKGSIRHIHKRPWEFPIPEFDAACEIQKRLIALSKEAQELVHTPGAQEAIDRNTKSRHNLSGWLFSQDLAVIDGKSFTQRLDEAVNELMGWV